MAPRGRRRLLLNAAAAVTNRILVFAIGLVMVPYLIGQLGKDGYGMFQVVRSFMQYLALTTLALDPALSRYFTYSVGSNDREGANRYMSAGLAAMVCLAGVLLVGGVILALLLPRLVEVTGELAPYRVLLLLLATSAALSFVATAFKAPLFAEERLAEFNAIAAIRELTRAAVIVAAFTFLSPRLEWIGMATLTGAGLAAVLTFVAGRLAMPWVRISPAFVDRSALGQLLKFSIYATGSSLVTVLFSATSILVIKWSYADVGAAMVTVYAAGASWELWVRGTMLYMIRVINPRLTLLAAGGDRQRLAQGVLTSVRYATGIVAPVACLLIVFGEPLLGLWLGDHLTSEEIHASSVVLAMLMVGAAADLGNDPVDSYFAAVAKLRVPVLAYLVVAVASVPISMFLAKGAGYGLFGVAGTVACGLAARALVIRPLYLRHLLGIGLWQSLGWAMGLPALLATVSVGGVGWVLREHVAPDSLLELGACFAAAGAIYAVAGLFLVVLPEDRARLLAAFRRLRARR